MLQATNPVSVQPGTLLPILPKKGESPELACPVWVQGHAQHPQLECADGTGDTARLHNMTPTLFIYLCANVRQCFEDKALSYGTLLASVQRASVLVVIVATAPAKTRHACAIQGPAKSATVEDSSNISELSDEDNTVRKCAKPTSATRRTHRRGALIPEDMWDWAYKKKPTTSRGVSAQHCDDDEEGEDESDEDEDNEDEHVEEDDGEEEEEEQGSPPTQTATTAHPSSSQVAVAANACASPTALAPVRSGKSTVSSDRASRDVVVSESEEEEEDDTREEGEIDEHSDTKPQ